MSDLNVSSYPPLPPLRGLFVTGTDTGVGKTLVAGAIARHLRHAGVDVEVFKPVASGCTRSRGELVSADAVFLAVCAGSQQTLSEISPVRLALPLAPNIAAEREGRPIELETIFDGWRRLAEEDRPVIVEGVGGLMCPITDDFWVIHLAMMMKMPLVVVARPGLGTINHTLLTVHAARSVGLSVAGVVINRYPVDGADAGDQSIGTNPGQIAGRGKVAVLAIVPDEQDNSIEQATVGADTEFAITQVDWMSLM